MTKTDLLGYLDKAKAIYVYVVLAGDDDMLCVPATREGIGDAIASDRKWWDDAVDYNAEWDGDEEILYVGRPE